MSLQIPCSNTVGKPSRKTPGTGCHTAYRKHLTMTGVEFHIIRDMSKRTTEDLKSSA